jgi:hypothetical protein
MILKATKIQEQAKSKGSTLKEKSNSKGIILLK